MHHSLIDERSLAFDLLTLEKIRKDPALIERARGNVKRWMVDASPRLQPVLEEWLAILDGSREVLEQALTGRDERSVRLRQSSPFAGIFTNAERTEILNRFRS